MHLVYCSCPKGKQLDWNKSFVRRGTEQATEPQPWDPAFLGSHPFSSALTAISLYRRNQKKKKNRSITEGGRVGVEKEPPLSLLSQTCRAVPQNCSASHCWWLLGWAPQCWSYLWVPEPWWHSLHSLAIWHLLPPSHKHHTFSPGRSQMMQASVGTFWLQFTPSAHLCKQSTKSDPCSQLLHVVLSLKKILQIIYTGCFNHQRVWFVFTGLISYHVKLCESVHFLLHFSFLFIGPQ